LELDGVWVRRNEMHEKVKEAWTKAQDSSDNGTGSQKREKS
jgi:hypothetical protein